LGKALFNRLAIIEKGRLLVLHSLYSLIDIVHELAKVFKLIHSR
jgi:hypothetical protein